MNPSQALLDDPAFNHVYIGALQHQLWEARHVEGGTEDHVILTYHGTGTGAPKYLARTARRWQDHPEAGWHVVAHIHADGTITPPTDQK